MQVEHGRDYRYTLIFPDANAFSCNDVLNFMVEVECPHDPGLQASTSNAEDRRETREYLDERLLASVVEGRFDVWNMYLNKVMAPPTKDAYPTQERTEKATKPNHVTALRRFISKTFSRPAEPAFMKALASPRAGEPPPRLSRNYKTVFWWARLTYILKSDLVKFCDAERIRVTFEGEGEQATSQTEIPVACAALDSNLGMSDTTVEEEGSQPPPAESQPEPDTQSSPEAGVATAAEQNPVPDVAPVSELSIRERDNLAESKRPLVERTKKPKVATGSNLVTETLKNFDTLPDSAYVDVKVVAALFNCSVSTLWRRVREGQLTKPHHLGTRTTRWQVGELRVVLGQSKPR